MLPLKELRKAAGLTQGDLAKTVGVTQPAVSAWERGTPVPEPLLVQVAAALGVDLSLLRPEAEQPDPRRRRRQRTPPGRRVSRPRSATRRPRRSVGIVAPWG